MGALGPPLAKLDEEADGSHPNAADGEAEGEDLITGFFSSPEREGAPEAADVGALSQVASAAPPRVEILAIPAPPPQPPPPPRLCMRERRSHRR